MILNKVFGDWKYFVTYISNDFKTLEISLQNYFPYNEPISIKDTKFDFTINLEL